MRLIGPCAIAILGLISCIGTAENQNADAGPADAAPGTDGGDNCFHSHSFAPEKMPVEGATTTLLVDSIPAYEHAVSTAKYTYFVGGGTLARVPNAKAGAWEFTCPLETPRGPAGHVSGVTSHALFANTLCVYAGTAVVCFPDEGPATSMALPLTSSSVPAGITRVGSVVFLAGRATPLDATHSTAEPGKAFSDFDVAPVNGANGHIQQSANVDWTLSDGEASFRGTDATGLGRILSFRSGGWSDPLFAEKGLHQVWTGLIGTGTSAGPPAHYFGWIGTAVYPNVLNSDRTLATPVAVVAAAGQQFSSISRAAVIVGPLGDYKLWHSSVVAEIQAFTAASATIPVRAKNAHLAYRADGDLVVAGTIPSSTTSFIATMP